MDINKTEEQDQTKDHFSTKEQDKGTGLRTMGDFRTKEQDKGKGLKTMNCSWIRKHEQ